MTVTVTSKGRVTIPKPIRDHLAIAAGDRVDFVVTPSGQVALTKAAVEATLNRFEFLRGRAGIGLSTDRIMSLTRR